MRKIFYDDNHQHEVTNKGYTTAGLLSGDEIAYILNELQKYKPGDDFAQTVNGEIRLGFHCTYLDADTRYRRAANALVREVFSPRIEEILVDYKIHTSSFFIKAPGRGYVAPHQHPAIVADFKETPITFWCPLVDADETNGTLRVVEGSHKILPELPMPCSAPCYKNFEDRLFEKYMKPIPARAGNCVIFDDNLIHGSQINASASFRPAVQISCTPQDARTVFFFMDRNQPARDFDVYEAGSEFFVENTVLEMVTPPPGLKKIGTVKNNNRPISEAEFAAFLKNGDEIRRRLYAADEE